MSNAEVLEQINAIARQLHYLSWRVEDLQTAVGRVECRQVSQEDSDRIHDREFKVFSQAGEDGIIQFLIDRVPIKNKVFVEFGIGDYSESNTRFLLKQHNWSGLVMDGSPQNIHALRYSPLYWQHNLKSECAFITVDNINTLISQNGIEGDIGLLSIDIDGNDYWIWDAIDCINPRIVICEYNNIFGKTAKVSIFYDENFVVNEAHYSWLYWGASIGALSYLAEQKGYSLVGSNTWGSNIFFVRNDLVGNIPTYTPEEAFVQSQFRISRDPNGYLSYLDRESGLKLIEDLPLCQVDTGIPIIIRDIVEKKLAIAG
jgi:hypothetical protein